MKAFPLPTIFFVLITLACIAPSDAAAQATKDTRSAENCPVSLHAVQGSGSGLVAVRDAQPAQGPSQRIRLVVNDAKAPHMISARVLVSGLTGTNPLMMPARSARDQRPEVSRTLDIRFVPDEGNSVAADLVLPGFTSVRAISMQSIAYDDGSTWTVAANRACQVAPDPMMLVAGR